MDSVLDFRYSFGEFTLDLPNAQLLKSGNPVGITPKAYDTLLCLCQKAGRLIPKDELLDIVWKRRFVSEGVLKNVIQEVRHVLGDNHKQPQYIQTVHRRGYKFIANVELTKTDELSSTNDVSTASQPANDGWNAQATLERMGLKWLPSGIWPQQPLTLLVGSAGMGKTSCITALINKAPRSALVFKLSCGDSETDEEALNRISTSLWQHCIREGSGLVRESILRYAPKVSARMPLRADNKDAEKIAGPSTSDPNSDLIAGELVGLFSALADTHSVCVCIDDVDKGSGFMRDVAKALADHCEIGKYKVYVTHGLPSASGVAQQTVADGFTYRQGANLCNLKPLSVVQVAERFSNTSSVGADSLKMAKAIVEVTGGLPLLIDAIDHSALVGLSSGGASEVARAHKMILRELKPAAKYLHDRWSGLCSSDELTVVAAMAIANRPLSAEEVSVIAEIPLSRVLSLVDRLVCDINILRVHDDDVEEGAAPTMRFALICEPLREQFYANLPQQLKQRIHYCVATWMKSTRLLLRGNQALEIGRHFYKGGCLSDALHHMGIALEEAVDTGDKSTELVIIREELEVINSAVKQAEGAMDWDLGVLEKLALVIQKRYGFSSSMLGPIYDKWEEMAQLLPVSESPWALIWGRWRYYLARGDLKNAQLMLGQLDAGARGALSEDAQASLKAAKGTIALLRGDLGLAKEMLDAARSSLRSDSNQSAQLREADLLSEELLLLIQWQQHSHDEYLVAGLSLIDGVQSKDVYLRTLKMWVECACLEVTKSYSHLLEKSIQMRNLAEENHFLVLRSIADVFMGRAQAAFGQHMVGIQNMMRGIQTLEGCNSKVFLGYFMLLVAEGHILCGDLSEAEALLRQARRIREETGIRLFDIEIKDMLQYIKNMDAISIGDTSYCRRVENLMRLIDLGSSVTAC